MIHERPLIERIERLDRALFEHYVDAQQDLYPEAVAKRTERGGIFALVDGAGLESRIAGFGDENSPDEATLDELIAWMQARLATPDHEDRSVRFVLSPLADAVHAERLAARGAYFVGVANVLTKDLANYKAIPLDPRISLGEGPEPTQASETIARAYANGASTPRGTMVSSSYGAIEWFDHFLMRVDGEPAAGAALAMRDGIAFLTGMAVLPKFRGRRLQTALIRHRLSLAKAAGCTVAVVTAATAGLSQRNLERNGFSAAYPRISLRLA